MIKHHFRFGCSFGFSPLSPFRSHNYMIVSSGNTISSQKNITKNSITKIDYSYYLTHWYFHSQIDHFITIYIDNEVWSREQKLENNALLCVENHPYNVLSRAIYNNTMKKKIFLFTSCLVGEIIVMHFGPSQ